MKKRNRWSFRLRMDLASEVLRSEKLHDSALLDHLAGMAQLQAGDEAARAEIARLQPLLRALSASIHFQPAAEREAWTGTAVAQRRIGGSTLHYVVDEKRIDRRAASEQVLSRIRSIVDERVPALMMRIGRLTRAKLPSVVLLQETYEAEEELMSITMALAELEALVLAPQNAREGHA